ncbi:PAS domain-containing protein [Methanoregula sp.]|uniref:PAS domain-containing protein n=1 Tax=Methanoregula sp. TaxID=2052170 RepID=UPI0023729B4E|nr:PAS domain-containing protein [Methanoregula sp.]MDD1686495.1 PAS domain-containing protein [Methanoregula sp.]
MDTTDAAYRDLVESQQDLIVQFNLEGRLLFVNKAYCDTVGKTREDLAGSVFMPVTEERYSDVIATQMTKLFRPPHACIVEQWMQTKKGLRCISWSAKSVFGADKAVVSIVATGRDITPLKNDQKSLRKRDEELMVLLESGSQMYYTHTLDHTLIFVSPRFRDLLGCHPGEGKRTWTDYLTDHPMNASGLERTIRAITSGKREPPYRLEMATRDGRKIWVEVNEVPVVKNGRTMVIAGSVTDVTDLMAVEEGRAEAEFLIKDVSGEQTVSEYRARVSGRKVKGPLGYFRSILSKSSDEENVGDVSAVSQENLK